MKTIKTTVIICAALVAMTACKKGGVFCYKPDGNVITQEHAYTGFDGIALGLEADVYITQSEIFNVEIEASENLHEIIDTKISGTTLEVDLKNRKCIKGDSQIKIHISMPTLNDLSVAGSGDVFISNMMEGSNLDISVSGSGNIELDSLNFESIETQISGSGDVYLFAIDTVQSQTIDISGSGKVESFNSPTKRVDIKVSGSGECEVNVVDELNVKISGSGEVIYMGNPVIDQNISGSVSVSQF